MNDISELSRQRIANNDILKILDSKRIEDVEIMNLKERPLINQYWNKESKQRIHNVVNMLKDKNIVFEKDEDRNGSGQKGIELVWDNTLVRGLDYYCHTTFEFVECRERKEEKENTREINDSDDTTTLRNTSTSSSSELLLGTQQGTVLAGGRYDELYSLLSDSKYNISAIGWAMGVDRIQLMLEGIEKEENDNMTEEKKTIRWPKEKNKICILPIAEKDWNGSDHLELITSTAVQIGIDLRQLNTKGEGRATGAIGEDDDDDETVSHRVIVSNNKMDRMKKQIKFSNRENAICSILVGGDELIERGCVSVRDMNTRTQKEVKVEDVAEYVLCIQNYF